MQSAELIFVLSSEADGPSWGRLRVAHVGYSLANDMQCSRDHGSFILHALLYIACTLALDAHPVWSFLGVDRASSKIGKRGDLSRRRCS